MSLQTTTSTLDEFSILKTYTPEQCKEEITKLLSGYEEGVLLWIVQHYFHNLHMKRLIPAHINPVNILYTRNIKKKTPPGSYSKIVMMLSYQNDNSNNNKNNDNKKEEYLDVTLHLFNSAYDMLKTTEY